jgi:tRNA-Thr(GGU) m(6)t(6)A37 methyltransferase TsaA
MRRIIASLPVSGEVSASGARAHAVETGATVRDVTDAFELRAIGRVESPLTDPASAPKQGPEGAPEAWLVLDPDVLDALEGLRPGDRVIVLTWLDRARRDLLRVHPRDDVSNPLQGVFNTRSADRPNPVGLHEVEITAIDGPRVGVSPLEAVDGTPVVDIEPVLGPPP